MTWVMNNKQLKPYIITMMALFFGFAFRGYLTAEQNPAEAAKIVNELFAGFDFLNNTNPLLLFLFIFANNAIKTLFAILLGFFFGIAPLFFIIANAFVIGMVISIVGNDIGVFKILIGIIPHGIIEIPASILASAYGLWLGIKFYKKIKKEDSFKKYLIFALKKYFKIIIPMLLGAALIEAFVTPLFL